MHRPQHPYFTQGPSSYYIPGCGIQEGQRAVQRQNNIPLSNDNLHQAKQGIPHRTPPVTTTTASPVSIPTTLGGSQDETFYVYLNNQEIQVKDVDPKMTLNEFIRDVAGKKGTKFSCKEGGCGACTCVISYHDMTTNQTSSVSVNSCLRPLASCFGMHITTVEGLGSNASGYSKIQTTLADHIGTQCGFCSPGMVMNMYSLLQRPNKPTQLEVERYFDGNICRCTGYRPILEAFKTMASDPPSVKKTHHAIGHHAFAGKKLKQAVYTDTGIKTLPQEPTPAQRLPHPHQLIGVEGDSSSVVSYKKGGYTFYVPTKLDSLYSLLTKTDPSDTSIIVGHTSFGIFKDQDPSTLIDISNIPELKAYHVDQSGLTLGSAVTITDTMDLVKKLADNNTSNNTGKVLGQLWTFMHRIASSQIRNAGSIAGNLCMVNKFGFVSDLCTLLFSLGATVTVGSKSDKLTLFLEDFISFDLKGYAVLSVFIPFPADSLVFDYRKIALRHVFSHAIINMAVTMNMDGTTIVGKPTIVVGGMTTRAQRMQSTEESLMGKDLAGDGVLTNALNVIAQEAANAIDTSLGQVEYRKFLVPAFLFKCLLSFLPSLPPSAKSAALQYDRPVSEGAQVYEEPKDEAPLGQFTPKIEGVKQCAGEIEYSGDIPEPQNCLYGAYVLSPVANGTMTNIALPDRRKYSYSHFITARDVKGVNQVLKGAPVFAEDKVVYEGQPIGMILASTERDAREAAAAVKISFSSVEEPIITLADAIEKKSFHPVNNSDYGWPLQRGDVDTGLQSAATVVKGRVSVGSQYHMHMETITALVHPKQGDLLNIYASTQLPVAVQTVLAQTLDMPMSNIQLEVRALGGGYGGKLTNSILVIAGTAAAARAANAPVKVVLSMSENMRMVGKRHAMISDYEIGFDSSNKLTAYKFTTYVDAGAFIQDSDGTTNTLLQNLDNAYYSPNVQLNPMICRTNTASNTYTRGPGWIPAVYIAEAALEDAAVQLGVPPEDLKLQNFYKANQVTPGGMTLKYWNMDTIWEKLKQSSNFAKRSADVAQYNKENKWIKKGISMVPVKFGVDWVGTNQAAKVNVYADGQVSVTHSGTEIGQGINTKVAQTVAHALGVPLELVTVQPTHTNTIAVGTSSTGGSTTSEFCCMAATDACEKLMDALKPVKTTNWQETITAAITAQIPLQHVGSYFGKIGPNGGIYQYNSYSAALLQVSVDILSGETQVETVDIVYDNGVSLNIAVDIGQIEGAFMMGLGLYLSEELKWDTTTGRLTSDGTWEYKPIMALDIPLEMNVTLLADAPNRVGFMSSKCTGEPPLALACALMFAVRHAIDDSRKERGLEPVKTFTAPATVEKIQLAAGLSLADLSM